MLRPKTQKWLNIDLKKQYQWLWLKNNIKHDIQLNHHSFYLSSADLFTWVFYNYKFNDFIIFNYNPIGYYYFSVLWINTECTVNFGLYIWTCTKAFLLLSTLDSREQLSKETTKSTERYLNKSITSDTDIFKIFTSSASKILSVFV